MFLDRFRRKTLPLHGVPPVRRLKTHPAQSGYIYTYAYDGQRALPAADGTEFVFSASAGPSGWHQVSVLVETSSVRAWELDHDRTLSSTEWYALAKMALFAAFDERPTPALFFAEPVRLRAADVEAIMQSLDLE